MVWSYLQTMASSRLPACEPACLPAPRGISCVCTAALFVFQRLKCSSPSSAARMRPEAVALSPPPRAGRYCVPWMARASVTNTMEHRACGCKVAQLQAPWRSARGQADKRCKQVDAYARVRNKAACSMPGPPVACLQTYLYNNHPKFKRNSPIRNGTLKSLIS